MAKSDTIDGMVSLAIEAQKELPDPPAHVALGNDEVPFFRVIVAGRQPSDWSDFRLTLAAQLAKAQAGYFREQDMLAMEGAVIENQRGTPVANPRATVLSQFSSQVLQLTRALSLQVATDPRDAMRKDKAFQQAKDVQNDLQDETLLA